MFKQIERLILVADKFDSKQLACFALSCCERQLPVYEKASSGQAWDGTGILRSHVDLAWKWLETNLQLPEDASENCESCAAEEPEGASAYVAFDIALSIGALMRYIKSGETNLVEIIAKSTYELLNELIYAVLDIEITRENDQIVDSHPLMLSENDRQEADLSLLQSSMLNGNLISLIRSRSYGQSIFGGMWFPADY